MTPSRTRGRPRSEVHRDAVLNATMELMQEDDLRRASIDRISARSGVSKATIYKWWPNRTAVAIDAFLHQMMADAPVPDTGSAAEDFRLTLRGMMGFYTSPLGAIYAQLVGESQFYPTERERIRTHQVNVRRGAVRKSGTAESTAANWIRTSTPRSHWISSSGPRCTAGQPGTED